MRTDAGRTPVVGTQYMPDEGDHQGHVVVVVAVDVPMPLSLLNQTIGFWPEHHIVRCIDCGVLWSFAGHEPSDHWGAFD